MPGRRRAVAAAWRASTSSDVGRLAVATALAEQPEGERRADDRRGRGEGRDQTQRQAGSAIREQIECRCQRHQRPITRTARAARAADRGIGPTAPRTAAVRSTRDDGDGVVAGSRARRGTGGRRSRWPTGTASWSRSPDRSSDRWSGRTVGTAGGRGVGFGVGLAVGRARRLRGRAWASALAWASASGRAGGSRS